MKFQKPYDWQAISEFAKMSNINSVRQLARETQIPRSSIRDAVMRGIIAVGEVNAEGPNEATVSVASMTQEEAWSRLPQFGYDPKDWILRSVIVGEYRDHISHRFSLTPRVIEGPKIKVTPTVYNIEKPDLSFDAPSLSQVHICIPDIHFGYIDDKPIHREDAIEPLLKFIWMSKPKTVVLLGDLLDLTEWTRKFSVLPSHIQKTQKAIDALSRFLAELRSAVNFGGTKFCG